MFLSYVTLLVALALSVIAAWYSIAGLAAIFAAAVIPIMIMGGVLEVAKVVTTLWLHEYWHRCGRLMKLYLVPAVAVLMLITSMGIFGFLSRAHSDQTLISGDAQSKIAVYDEKIKTQEENIAAARRALEQMDAGVDQVLGRSTTETGARRAMDLRRAQQRERARIQDEISQSQQLIAELKDARAPIAADIRKIEAEVGPIKYIAALIYGDKANADLLEKAVTWVIILLVVVFDPLAIMMLLAATQSLRWHREQAQAPVDPGPEPATEPEPSPEPETESTEPESNSSPVQDLDDIPLHQKYPYLNKPFAHFSLLKPMVAKPNSIDTANNALQSAAESDTALVADATRDELFLEKLAQLAPRPDRTTPGVRFGTGFPASQVRGAMFIRVDQIPHKLYKFNGRQWIDVDKVLNYSYTYDTSYIDYLISQLVRGSYDVEMLTDQERDQIEARLQQSINHP